MIITRIKQFLKKTYVYDAIQFFLQKKIYWVWRKKGIGNTPHCVKEKVLLRYASLFNISTLVETGTFLGDMIKAVKRHFQTIYSIELDKQLYYRAKIRFGKIKHIHFLQGDSAQVLPKVLSLIREPCLFWLDAHYSGGITAKECLETPIVQELRLILSHPLATEHVILIDDARNFVGANDYPTLEQLDNMISLICPSFVMEVQEDIIRIMSRTPKTGQGV